MGLKARMRKNPWAESAFLLFYFYETRISMKALQELRIAGPSGQSVYIIMESRSWLFFHETCSLLPVICERNKSWSCTVKIL